MSDTGMSLKLYRSDYLTLQDEAELVEQEVMELEVKAQQQHPDRCFGDRLRSLERNAMHIQYLLACLSTLGGANHLCNRPIEALALARRQELVGRRLGSTSVIIRAQVFQAINQALLGNVQVSRQMFKSCLQSARKEEWLNLEVFVLASKNWLERELLEQKKLAREGLGKVQDEKEEEEEKAAEAEEKDLIVSFS